MRILGISGSLRRDSHNTSLLRAAALSLPPGVELELFDGLGDLPHYNTDIDGDPAPSRSHACARRSPRPTACSSPRRSSTPRSPGR